MTTTKRAVQAQGVKAATTTKTSKAVIPAIDSPVTIIQDNLPADVRDELLKDLQQHLQGGDNVYRFVLTGKNTFIHFEVTPTKAVAPERIVYFMTANIYERVKNVFALPYARHFSKGKNMQLYFCANGKIMDTAKISSQLGITLKPAGNQFVAREDGIAPFKGKIQDVIQASLIMMDTKDYSLPA